MKRTFAILLALILSLGLIAGCANTKTPGPSGTNADTGTPKPNTGAKEYAVSVTPPEGWTPVADNVTLVRYKKDSGSFWVKQGPLFGALEEKVADYKETESGGGYEIAWGDVKDVKVNGMDAKNLDYTVDTGSIKMSYNAYFIEKDATVFTVICMTIPDSDHADLASDYAALLDSLSITEK